MLQHNNVRPRSAGHTLERLFNRRTLLGLLVAAYVGSLAALGPALPASSQDAAPADAPATPIFGAVTLEAAPKNVYLESDTRLWYTLPTVDKLALVENGSVTYRENVDKDPAANGQPYDLVVQGGTVWFTLLAANKIGKLDIASGSVTVYNVPTANSEPTGIAYGGGYVWFVERKGDKLGRLDPVTGAITEFYDWVFDYDADKNLVDMRGALLEDVAYEGGNVWFTGPKLRLGGADLYNAASGKWVASPNKADAAPMQIATDSLGNVWVSFSGLNYIGRSALNTLAVWDVFGLPASTAGPVGLFVREANNVRELWYTRPDANGVGFVTTRINGVTVSTWETTLPTANAAPWGIAVTSSGSAWLATANAARTVSWNPPYYSFFLQLPQLLCNAGLCLE